MASTIEGIFFTIFIINNMRKARSSSYQHLYFEIPISHYIECINHPYTEYFSDEINEINDKIYKRMLTICKKVLTKHQLQIMLLRLSGHTQVEIARILNTTQSAICRAISGATEYSTKSGKKLEVPNKYGGIQKKIKNIQDDKLDDLIEKKISTNTRMECY
jgi:predicted DNA-binding protein YlxM (UPF0122 family)